VGQSRYTSAEPCKCDLPTNPDQHWRSDILA
jgi:hypothetical protein